MKRIKKILWLLFISFINCNEVEYITVDICGDEGIIEEINWISLEIYSPKCGCSYKEIYNLKGIYWPLTQSIIVDKDPWRDIDLILKIEGYTETDNPPIIVKTVIIPMDTKKISVKLSSSCKGINICNNEFNFVTGETCIEGECKTLPIAPLECK